MEGETNQTNPGGDFDVPTGSQEEMDVEQAEKSPIYFKNSADALTGKNGRDGDDDDGDDDDDEAAPMTQPMTSSAEERGHGCDVEMG